MRKKTKVENPQEAPPTEVPTVDLKEHQDLLNQNALLKELKNLEDNGYYRLQMTSTLGKIAQHLETIARNLEEVAEVYIDEEEDEEKD